MSMMELCSKNSQWVLAVFFYLPQGFLSLEKVFRSLKTIRLNVQKMKFSIKDFFSKCH